MASDAPISVIETLSGGFRTNSNVQSAIEFLKKLRDQRALVTLATRHQTYTSMAVTSISISRSASTGEKLPYTITFQEVRVVRSNEVNANFAAVDAVKAPVGQGTGSATTDAGKKSAEAANAAEASKGSIAYQLAQGLGVL